MYRLRALASTSVHRWWPSVGPATILDPGRSHGAGVKTLTDHLSTYATYHRDRRNIATHFVGVPMIFLAVVTLLSRPAVDLGGIPGSPALLVSAGALAFYLRLDLRFGAVMTALTGLALWGGAGIAARSTGVWLGTGLGLFGVGWVIQFVGHYFEGKKPAFVDDLIGLLVGPLFVVAEAGFALRLRPAVQAAIEHRAGPTRAATAAAPLAEV